MRYAGRSKKAGNTTMTKIKTVMEILDAAGGILLLGALFALLCWGTPEQRSAEADAAAAETQG